MFATMTSSRARQRNQRARTWQENGVSYAIATGAPLETPTRQGPRPLDSRRDRGGNEATNRPVDGLRTRDYDRIHRINWTRAALVTNLRPGDSMKRRDFITALAASAVPSAHGDEDLAQPTVTPAPSVKPLSVTLLGTGTPSPSLDRQSSGRPGSHRLGPQRGAARPAKEKPPPRRSPLSHYAASAIQNIASGASPAWTQPQRVSTIRVIRRRAFAR